jgi:excisionase family DNA binding protein
MSSSTDRGAPASYSTAELARRLGVSTPTVQRWVDLGYIKAWKTAGGHRRIDADSAERFLVEQRLSAVDETPAAAARAAGGPVVLIVDDNPDDRDLLSALVESTLPAATVSAVENGFQALVAIGRSPPDVLVTDIVMPHMNGLEMIKHLCGGSAQRPGRVLAVTSHSPEQIAKLGGLPDGVRLVRKPIDPDTFADALRAAVDAGSLPARPSRPAET